MTEARVTQAAVYALVNADGGGTVNVTQSNVYALATAPAETTAITQGIVYAVAGAETLGTVNVTQSNVYALVKGLEDRRELRAWTFTQDDHDFYVLQLGDVATLVYDKLTQQWSQWKSPSFTYWRGNDGLDWEGLNVSCDNQTGIIWKIDDEGRLDYETTPITSVITGGLTERFRKHVPCYMAELAVSEGSPPTGFEDGTVGITLRTGDGLTWVNHGQVVGGAQDEDISVRWYGLGLIKSPGMVFELTDTGYARRIDGLNIELGDYSG